MMRRTIMTNDIDYGPYEPAELPAPVKRYLEAHQLARDEDAAAATFAPGARVVDEKIEYRSADAIGGWLRKANGQYTYTTDLTGQRTDGPGRWAVRAQLAHLLDHDREHRSEEHTSELQSLMRISYAVFCLKKKTKK